MKISLSIKALLNQSAEEKEEKPAQEPEAVSVDVEAAAADIEE